MANYFDVVLWALVGGLFSMVGGVLLLSRADLAHRFAQYAAPFAAGALLGATFFDLLPEAVDAHESSIAFLYALVGIVVFFILEHYLNWFHHHHEHTTLTAVREPAAPLIIIGDILHNAIDGVVIGAAFLISVPVGIATAIAVAAHEIPKEIGTFGILLKSGMRRSRVLGWNVVTAVATLVGALVTFWLGTSTHLPVSAILGLAAGMFIYIAASDLLPTIHQEAKGRFAHLPLLLLIFGAFLVWIVTDQTERALQQATDRAGSQSKDTR